MDSGKLSGLGTLDLSGDNKIDSNFPLILRLIKEKCEGLSNLFLAGNRGIKNSANL